WPGGEAAGGGRLQLHRPVGRGPGRHHAGRGGDLQRDRALIPEAKNGRSRRGGRLPGEGGRPHAHAGSKTVASDRQAAMIAQRARPLVLGSLVVLLVAPQAATAKPSAIEEQRSCRAATAKNSKLMIGYA